MTLASRSPSYDALNDDFDGQSFYKMGTLRSNKSYKVYNEYNGASHRSSSLSNHDTTGHVIALRESEKVLTKPVEGAIRYYLSSKRSSGSIGKLILTNMRIHFVNYHQTTTSTTIERKLNLPPFDLHSFLEESKSNTTDYDEDINFINIHSFKQEVSSVSTAHLLLIVHCNDFRQIEFQLANSMDTKCLIDELEKQIAVPSIANTIFLTPNSRLSTMNVSPQRIVELPLLWYKLSTDYRYYYSSDWQIHERKLLANQFVRITHINEDLQMSANLPRTFITFQLSKLSDLTLDSTISRQMRGSRVPVITYATIKELKLRSDQHPVLMRSPALTEDVANHMRKACGDRLRVLDLQLSLPTLPSIEAAYFRIQEASFLDSVTTNFITSTGKWIKIVFKALRKAEEVANILVEDECSVLITEEADRFWNPIVSILAQVILNPDRRTIRGFEALLSKELMYITGAANKYPEGIKSPNHLIIVLLVDCVHQLIARNFREFEFTSLYLIRLFDLNYIPSPFSANQSLMNQNGSRSYEDLTNIHRVSTNDSVNRRSSFHPSLARKMRTVPDLNEVANKINYDELPMTLSELTSEQLMYLFNPLHIRRESDSSIVHQLCVPYRLMQMQLFEGLYLRWHRFKSQTTYYNKYPHEQSYYFNRLIAIQERERQMLKNGIVMETEL